jgi:hypothetical protein
MATLADILRRAHRKLGLVRAGGSPTGHDVTDGIEVLQSVILGLPGLLHGARWNDVSTDTAYTAGEGERIEVTAPGAVTLPTSIATAGGYTRQPLDMARVQILGDDTDEMIGTWVYSRTNAAWARVTDLDETDDSPFGPEDTEGLACQLAVALAPEFGEAATLAAYTLSEAQKSARSFRSRFKRAEPRDSSRPDDFIDDRHDQDAAETESDYEAESI